MILEITKFILYSGFIVLISKYILVTTLRKLAENLNLKAKIVGNIAGYATSIPELLTISISSINGLLGTSIFNILSSNVINFFQYVASIIINKNKSIIVPLEDDKNISITFISTPVICFYFIIVFFIN